MAPSPPPAADTPPPALFELMPIMAYLLRAEADDFVLEGVNAAAREKTPALSAMLGRRISLLYADQPQIIADAHRCRRERTRVVRETSVRRHGRMDSVRQTLVFTSLDADRIVIYAQQASDSENKSAELTEVEERYRSLLASLPSAMILLREDARVVACNDAAARLFGHHAASDLWGHVDLLAPGYRVETESGEPVVQSDAPSQRSARTGQAVYGELYRFIAADGSARWMRVSAQPVRKLDGSLAGSVALFSDETERVLARIAEREAALQLQLALDAGRMGTWQFDPLADSGEWSATLKETFNLGLDQPGFASYLTRVHEDDREAVASIMREVLGRPDGAAFEHEHRLVGVDNVTRWARIRGRVERSAKGFRLLGTAMDVTERRRMQDELLHAGRLESLGRLAGGLAHDFNNLLAAMLGTIELLGDTCSAEGQPDLDTLRHVTLRARDLTAQLLAFARQQRTELETLDLRQLVLRATRLLERLVGPTVQLEIDLGPAEIGPLFVRADAAQLEQVLVNLVINARDAMPEGGHVNVRLSAASGPAGAEQVVLEVVDQGRGIEREHLAHVFDPFFTTKETGTGLGLASSYGVIRAHRGNISVSSEPGRGACFRVSLPRAAAEIKTVNVPEGMVAGKGRVLVVDDDAAVRVSTTRMLQTLGYEVWSAADGAAAEERARSPEGGIDFLVCDLAMPNKNGPEVAESIRLLHPDIKVLFVSGYPRGAERELPAESFLQKPYDRDALSRKLSALGRATR